MLWVKLGTHITDHERFLAIGPHARDLWTWGMLYAGKHETDGELPLSAVLTCAWGAGPKGNAKLAAALVAIGLWRQTETGFAVCRWSEQGNETKESLVAKREAGRERKARADERRNGVRNGVTPSVRNGVRNAKGSTSTSLSDLDLSSGSEIASELPTGVRERVVEPIVPVAGGPPAWFLTSLDVVAMATGVALPPGESWLRYDGHREGKGMARTPSDAQYWLTGVMVPEARELLRVAARDRERDVAFKQRGRVQGPEPPPKLTKQQSEAFAEELAARMGLKAR